MPEMCDQEWLAAISLVLARRTDPGLVGLVGLFESLPPHRRSDVVARVDALDHGIRLALRHDSFSVRSSAIALILKSGRLRFADELSHQLTHGCVKTRILCARALEQMVCTNMDDVSVGNTVDSRRVHRNLRDAIDHALETWSRHHRPEILRVLIRMGGTCDPSRWIEPGRSQSHLIRALGETFRQQLSEESGGFAWRSLTVPELRKEVMGTISRSTNEGFWKGLMKEAWLLSDPKVAAVCRQLHRIAWLEMNDGQTPPVDDASARHALRLLVVSGIPETEKHRLLSDWYRFGTRPWRYAVLWSCASIGADWVTDVFRRMADDSDEKLSRLARRLLRGTVSLNEVTRSSGESEVPRDFASLWMSFEGLSPERLRSVVANLEEDHRVIERLIRRKWASSEPRDRLRGLRLVQLLGWHTAFEEEIYRSMHDSCAFVKATSIIALGELQTPTARRLIMMSLNDADGRTQANAVEAASQFEDEDMIRLLEPKLESPVARVRANAVVALIRRQHRPAAETLSAMLHSELPSMRLSGLWAAEMIDARALADRIRQMAECDKDPKTRSRARDLMKKLSSSRSPEEAMS